MTEGSDRFTVERIVEMNIADLVDAARNYAWTSPRDGRTADHTSEVNRGFDLDGDREITTEVLDEMVGTVVERHEQWSKDRLKGSPMNHTHSFPFLRAGAERVWGEVADATIHTDPETYECGFCFVSRPAKVSTRGEKQRMECYGECDGRTVHAPKGVDWDPVRLEFECPECGYETLMYDDPEEWPPECPECPPPPEGPDGIPVVPSEHASVDDVPGAVDATGALDELTDVGGVSQRLGMALITSGYYSKADLRRASMDELREVESVGQALAARIKADVGDPPDTDLILVDVRLRDDVDD